jgi:hypothetical protein
VEGAHPQGAGNGGPDEVFDSPAHFPSRLVGKGHGKDALRRDAVLTDQRGNSVREDPGLPGAGAGKDQKRAVSVVDRFALGWVQKEVDIG